MIPNNKKNHDNSNKTNPHKTKNQPHSKNTQPSNLPTTTHHNDHKSQKDTHTHIHPIKRAKRNERMIGHQTVHLTTIDLPPPLSNPSNSNSNAFDRHSNNSPNISTKRRLPPQVGFSDDSDLEFTTTKTLTTQNGGDKGNNTNSLMRNNKHQQSNWLDSKPLMMAAISSSDDDDDDNDDDDNGDDDSDCNIDSNGQGNNNQVSLSEADFGAEGEFDFGEEGETDFLHGFEGEFDEEFLRMLADGTDSDDEEESDDVTQNDDDSGNDNDDDPGYEIDASFKQDLSNLPFGEIMRIVQANLLKPQTTSSKTKTAPIITSKSIFQTPPPPPTNMTDDDPSSNDDEIFELGDYEGEDDDGLADLFAEGDEGDFFHLFGEGEEDVDDKDQGNSYSKDLSGLDFSSILSAIQGDLAQGDIFLDFDQYGNVSQTYDSNCDTRDVRTTTPDEEKTNPYVVQVTRKPEIHLSRLQLPVCSQESEIMDIVHHNDVTILSGETGSGKTTQLPQFLYEAGYCRDGIVGITQPRRVAAISAANRVQDELNTHPARVVGYQIRFENNCTKDTRIKMMTEGVLLREIQSDFLLSRYTSIVIDEAHERGLNTDILLGLLSRIVPLRNQIVNICHQLIQHGLLPHPDPFCPDNDHFTQQQQQQQQQQQHQQRQLQANNNTTLPTAPNLSSALSTTHKINNNNETATSTFYERLSKENKSFFDAIIAQCMASTTNTDEVIMGFTPKRLQYLPFDLLATRFALNGISRGKLKIIIMSATLRVTDFTQNYKLFPLPPPVYTVNSRQYPVDIHFSRITPVDYVDKCLQKVTRVHTRLPPGAVLVFLTGREEIESFCAKLREVFPAPTPGEDNSVSTHNTSLGAGRLYLKALRMVKQTLMANNIAVDFGSEKIPPPSIESQSNGGTKAGQVITTTTTTFAKAQDTSAEQRRWNLLSFAIDDDIEAQGVAPQVTPHSSESLPTLVDNKTPRNSGLLDEPKVKHSSKAALTMEEQKPAETITPQMLKYLINRQVIVIKEAERKNKEFRAQGRATTKATRGAAFSLEEIAQAEQGGMAETMGETNAQHLDQQPRSHEITLIKPVNVVVELFRYRQQQSKVVKALELKEKGEALRQGEPDGDLEDLDEDDEALYELSDDDDYDDEAEDVDERTDNSDDRGGLDKFQGQDDDHIEDETQTVLQREQRQSQQSAEKQKQRWEEELQQIKIGSPIPLLVLPLYAMLPTSEQMKVFQWEKYSHGARVVIVSTNMAETSVTIPNIKYVIDSGREKVKNVEIQTGATNFTIGFIPQSSAGQRAGRAGRTGPGHAYRIFSGAVYNDHFPLHSTPEILKQPFENTLLQMKSIGIHDITRFPFPTPPIYQTVRTAAYILYVIGALQTKQEKLFQSQQEDAIEHAKSKSGLVQGSNGLLNHHAYIQQRRVADSSDKPFLLQSHSKWEMHRHYQLQQGQKHQSQGGGFAQQNKNVDITTGMTKLQKKQFLKQQEEEREQGERIAQQKLLLNHALESIEAVRVPTAGGTQYNALIDFDITPLGETLAFFPLHPRFSKIIMTCANQPIGSLSYGIALTSVMTIQEIQQTPRFVVEYEVAAKKSRAKRRLKLKKGIKNEDESDSDDEIDITAFDSEDDEDDIRVGDNDNAAVGKNKKGMDDDVVLGEAVHDDLAQLMQDKAQKKLQRAKRSRDEQKAEARKRKEWLQEQYKLYRTKCEQFLVPDSDLFTKLNIFGAYLFARNSAINNAWKSHSKALVCQYHGELQSGKLSPLQYEDLCWKYNLQPMCKEFCLIKTTFRRLENIPQISQGYQQLPPKMRLVVDKKLNLWCRQHYVRSKGLADCYKLFQQVQKIVVSYLQSKIKDMLKSDCSSQTKSNLDGEQDGELRIADIMLGDQDDEENDNNQVNGDVSNRPQKIKKLDLIEQAKVERMTVLLNNLALFQETLPPPSKSTYTILQQVILASFADKIAWKMSEERKQFHLDRSILQKSAMTSKLSPQAQLQAGEPIRLIPRPRNYNETTRLRISNLQQRFSRIQDGLNSPEYNQQLNEIIESTPLSMNDLNNAYETLDSDQPVFISPQSIIYKKQNGFMNQLKEIRNSNPHSAQATMGANLPTQALQQFSATRKLKGSLISQVQLEMDNELKFILYHDVVQDQGKYHITFLNDCTMLNEKWLPVICHQLCHIQSFVNSPLPFMKSIGDGNVSSNPNNNNNNNNNVNKGNLDETNIGLSKLARAKLSHPSKSQPNSSTTTTAAVNAIIPNPLKSELYRYGNITYGHKKWELQPYAVPYLNTVISTAVGSGSRNNNGLREEDLTENTGTMQQYYQHLGKAIVDGTLFPFLKPLIPFYTQPPTIFIEQKLREPALQFIQCLQHHNIYNIRDLYNIWYGKSPTVQPNPRFLQHEFFMFITNKEHRQTFQHSWPPVKKLSEE